MFDITPVFSGVATKTYSVTHLCSDTVGGNREDMCVGAYPRACLTTVICVLLCGSSYALAGPLAIAISRTATEIKVEGQLPCESIGNNGIV